MKLKHIDKATYRSNLNKIIVTFVATFAILALVFGSILISFFGDIAVGDEQVNNFRFNLAGVILALITVGAILSKARHHVFFEEVYFVWQLKQLHNLIYRKLKKIKAAAKNDDINALITLNFYYTSLKLVYELDDNTLTIANVTEEKNKIQEQANSLQVTLLAEQFNRDLLKPF